MRLLSSFPTPLLPAAKASEPDIQCSDREQYRKDSEDPVYKGDSDAVSVMPERPRIDKTRQSLYCTAVPRGSKPILHLVFQLAKQYPNSPRRNKLCRVYRYGCIRKEQFSTTNGLRRTHQ